MLTAWRNAECVLIILLLSHVVIRTFTLWGFFPYDNYEP